MAVVQISMANRGYAEELERLLIRDGRHEVKLLPTPDLSRSGVVVVDVACFNGLERRLQHPGRVVLVANRNAESLSRAWEAGLSSVVFEDDPVQTTLLAVMAAELRLQKPAEGLA